MITVTLKGQGSSLTHFLLSLLSACDNKPALTPASTPPLQRGPPPSNGPPALTEAAAAIEPAADRCLPAGPRVRHEPVPPPPRPPTADRPKPAVCSAAPPHQLSQCSSFQRRTKVIITNYHGVSYRRRWREKLLETLLTSASVLP